MAANRKVINDYCYNCKNRLGDGVSSEVYAGYNQKTNEPVAIKIIPKLEHCREHNLLMAETEIKVLQELSGKPHITQLHFTTHTKNNIYIVIQLAMKGSLAELIKNHGKLPEATALRYLQQTIHGYRALAQHHYLHRDIKPNNLVLTTQDQLLIADFGLCTKTHSQDPPSFSRVGSPLYMAPEIVDDSATQQNSLCYSHSSDIWAIGLTFLEMLLGRPAMKAQKERELIEEVLAFDVNKVLPGGLSKQSERFLRKSLEKDPLKRMTLEEMLSFFEEKEDCGTCEQTARQLGGVNTKERSSNSNSPIKENNLFLQDHHGKNSMSPEPFKQTLTTGCSGIQRPSKKERKLSYQEIALITPKVQGRERKQSENFTSLQVIPQRITKSNAQRANQQEKTLEELLEEDPEEQKQCQQSSRAAEAVIKEDILKQLQGHINYFRFVFKLLKKIKESLRIKDEGIEAFKACLLYLFSSALKEAKALSHIQNVEPAQLDRFRASAHYSNLVFLLDSYGRKCQKQQEKDYITASYKGDNSFMALLDYVMKVLYHNIVSFENSPQELNRKKILVFLLEDLMVLVQAVLLSKKYNWRQVNRRAGLSEQLQERGGREVSEEYWRGVRAKFQSLTSK